ncbi:molybdate ABC transporter substrate-binding protein [Amphritea sp. HPY]|uniref:molybdate ABC transporter substrate-binding protein n=1 Tax=Amphritea sp. HPY TaxID=3421652 RepID=UPI003D7E579B
MKLIFTALCFVLLSLNTVRAEQPITVFAASSMTNAVDEVVSLYRQQHDEPVRTSYASSSALARQIASGAPVDIYISANQRWMEYLEQQQLIQPGSRRTLLQNSLVLVTSTATPLNIDQLQQIPGQLGQNRLAIADPDHVPAGIYSQQALKNLQLWSALKPKLARSHNVRAALLLVERGETPLGLVYRTDALISNKVQIISQLPAISHQPIEYPIALIRSPKQSPSVVALYDFLLSAEASAVFMRHGFQKKSAE